MSGTIYQAAAGAIMQQMRLDVLSNNLANVNTAGFKADNPIFRLATDADAPEANSVPPSAAGLLSPYAPPMASMIDFAPGAPVRTANPLDVAITGKGFFEVQTPEGSRFTRNGHFSLNDQGVLITAEGWPVMGQGGEIAIDGSRVEISDQGDVMVDGQAVDSLRVVDFPEPYALQKSAGTLFAPQAGVEPEAVDAEEIQVSQGFVESSNVNAIRTMTELIETLRVFESYQRVIRTADDATSKTVNEVGRSV